MGRKRFNEEQILDILRQIELSLASGSDVSGACRSARVSEATYYAWRKKYGGMGKSQLNRLCGELITSKIPNSCRRNILATIGDVSLHQNARGSTRSFFTCGDWSVSPA